MDIKFTYWILLVLCLQVKPVRDTVQQALHYWRNLPGSGTSEPSEAGSFIKGLIAAGSLFLLKSYLFKFS